MVQRGCKTHAGTNLSTDNTPRFYAVRCANATGFLRLSIDALMSRAGGASRDKECDRLGSRQTWEPPSRWDHGVISGWVVRHRGPQE